MENHDVDFIRSTLPNAGGITEMMKVAAICETHAVGIVPHFTGLDKVFAVAKEYFLAKPRPIAEKYFWKNSVAAYKWVKRDPSQPTV